MKKKLCTCCLKLNSTNSEIEYLYRLVVSRYKQQNRVPKRMGLIPDGMVQAQLSNFVVRFPNLGVVGGCKQKSIVCDIKTESCQLDLSGGKRNGGLTKISKTEKQATSQVNYRNFHFYLETKQNSTTKLVKFSTLSHSSIRSGSTSIAKEYNYYIKSLFFFCICIIC